MDFSIFRFRRKNFHKTLFILLSTLVVVLLIGLIIMACYGWFEINLLSKHLYHLRLIHFWVFYWSQILRWTVWNERLSASCVKFVTKHGHVRWPLRGFLSIFVWQLGGGPPKVIKMPICLLIKVFWTVFFLRSSNPNQTKPNHGFESNSIDLGHFKTYFVGRTHRIHWIGSVRDRRRSCERLERFCRLTERRTSPGLWIKQELCIKHAWIQVGNLELEAHGFSFQRII